MNIKQYLRGKFLGKGGFAKCYELKYLDGSDKVDAVKIVPKAMLAKERAKQKLLSEIKIHKGVKHANVVDFKHVFEDNDNVYMILELCPQQTLNELIKRRVNLTELESRYYIAQILSCLDYLHQNQIIHREYIFP